MEQFETRQQSLTKIDFFKGLLSDKQLRIVVAFMRGFVYGR